VRYKHEQLCLLLVTLRRNLAGRKHLNGYECCAGALAALFLSSLGRFLVAHQSAKLLPTPIENRHLGALQSAYVILVFSALAFLCKDGLVWTWYAFLTSYASENPFGPWQVLVLMLSVLNLLALILPFLFYRKLSTGYGNRGVQLITMAVAFLWFSNVSVTYLLWGAFCGFCYFG
jgi:hypothetical protein